ncbi:hypothetical protein AX14_006179 [Amanita brunnescens Koide BX004]|nr:hypothetical protein AX14_006179 [Amanita brunnescens Koide BX004]
MSTSIFFYEPFNGFDRLFSEAFDARHKPNRCGSNDRGADAGRALRPRMDLHENADSNTVTATFELPGLSKENIQIDIHNDRLNISGESQISSEHEESGYAVRERRYGKFARTLQLPRGVMDDQITAKMEDGVLTVTFPRSTPETAPKKVTVA